MVRRPRIETIVDAFAALLADQSAVERLARPGGIEEVDSVLRAEMTDRRVFERIRVDLPIRVPETGLGDRDADGPGHRFVDPFARTDRLGAVVEVRRLVVVAGEEHRVALRDELLHLREGNVERRGPYLVLGCEDLLQRRAVAQKPGPVLH